jgi:hypothetical protein
MAVGRKWVWHGNKSFIMKGRGSSVVEQPIRNRQVESSTLSLGSKFSAGSMNQENHFPNDPLNLNV